VETEQDALGAAPSRPDGWTRAAVRSLRAALSIVRWALAGVGLIALTVTATPLVSGWAGALAGGWGEPRGDILIVLGGSILGDGMPGENSYWRAVYATLAWRQGGFRQIVIAGGGRMPMPIAVPIRDFLECQGVPPAAIRIETRSRSTRENALFVSELLAGAPGRKVLLTSDYHMFRARRAFAKVGLDVLPRPYPDVRKRGARWTGRWGGFVDLVVESGKIGYYYARGWI
jgi:uncharacterized SAM-binding protein YcdF (DUF218 family)